MRVTLWVFTSASVEAFTGLPTGLTRGPLAVRRKW